MFLKILSNNVCHVHVKKMWVCTNFLGYLWLNDQGLYQDPQMTPKIETSKSVCRIAGQPPSYLKNLSISWKQCKLWFNRGSDADSLLLKSHYFSLLLSSINKIQWWIIGKKNNFSPFPGISLLRQENIELFEL